MFLSRRNGYTAQTISHCRRAKSRMFSVTVFRSFLTAIGVCLVQVFVSQAALAAATKYPLTIDNCGAKITISKAPQRAIGLGQNSAEIMLLLGLQDRMAATAFWPSKVLPQLAEANAKVKLLTVEFPTFETILAENPDFVAAALPSLVGPSSKVAKREDFDKVGVPTYLSPSTCLSTEKIKNEYGSRDQLWNMDQLYKEIDELSQIFDVADRGQALIADLKTREAALRASVSKDGKSCPMSSGSPAPARRQMPMSAARTAHPASLPMRWAAETQSRRKPNGQRLAGRASSLPTRTSSSLPISTVIAGNSTSRKRRSSSSPPTLPSARSQPSGTRPSLSWTVRR